LLPLRRRRYIPQPRVAQRTPGHFHEVISGSESEFGASAGWWGGNGGGVEKNTSESDTSDAAKGSSSTSGSGRSSSSSKSPSSGASSITPGLPTGGAAGCPWRFLPARRRRDRFLGCPTDDSATDRISAPKRFTT